MSYKKGFSQLVILIIGVIAIAVLGGGYWYYRQAAQQGAPAQVVQETPPPVTETETQPNPETTEVPEVTIPPAASKETAKEQPKTPIIVTPPPPPPAATAPTCNPPLFQRQFSNTPYYTGQLFDAHFHMPQFFKIPNHPEAPVLDQDISKKDVACLFGDQNRIKGAFAFYGIPSNLKTTALQSIKSIEQQFPGTISHFLEYVVFPGYSVVPSEIENILAGNKGLFKGYGEISLYLPHYSSVKPNDPAMRELYGIAGQYGLPVYIHPIEGQQQAIEEVLRDYPNTQFIFHGAETLSSANLFYDTFLDKYPNAHYGVDIVLYGEDAIGRPLLDDQNGKQDFIAKFKQNWQSTLDSKVAFWKSKIERHPNQFLWGTDRGSYRWHYDEDINALLEEYSRAFVGQLDSAVQEKYAYKNAETLLQRR